MLRKKTTVFFLLFTCYAAFSAWVYTKGTEQPTASLSEEVLRGKKIWQQKNCIACHQLYGLGGYLGADLTHIISDPAKGKSYATAFIKSGGSTMPDFHFTHTDIEAIIAYLSYVDASAKTNNQ